MNNEYRKKKIVELKRKNLVNNICKEWFRAGIDIKLDDFISLKKTMEYQLEIIQRLDSMDSGGNYSLCAENCEEKMVFHLKKFVNQDINYIFFEKEATKCGAIALRGKLITDNAKELLKKSEFNDKGCCFFLCSEDKSQGFCIWRNEYDIRLYLW